MLPGSGNEQGAVVKLGKMLLGSLTPLMLAGAVLFLVRDLAFGTGQATLGLFLLVLALGVAAAVLFVAKQLSLLQLRAIELATFGSVAAYLSASSYLAISDLLAQGQAGLALARWNVALLQVVLLMVAYGTFVPNSWGRAAIVVGLIAAAPAATGTALRYLDPTFSSLVAETMTLTRIADSLAILAVGAGLAILAAYIIGQYFNAAYEARDVNVYSLIEKIGAGGMGEVWLAEHNVLARPAAIKLIQQEIAGDGDSQKSANALRRFEREAKATARLRSPHTVEIYDFGVTNEGTFYYAMEYLDGVDLNTLVEQHGPLPPERLVYLLTQACDSLADAHHNGMTHRDVKPANIYACRLGLAHDFIKVLDFGLVKTTSQAEFTTQLTVEGMTSGTPAFMAPELATGEIEVDGRADIYALGCVGYYLLTGKQVFESDSPVSVIVDHVKTDPVPPSQRTEIEIPAELEAVIMKCLEKDRGNRYQTATELAEALAACPLPHTWDARRATEWWNLHMPRAA